MSVSLRCWVRPGLALGMLALFLLSSCAYYNTFYLARKYYEKGVEGRPYPTEKADPSKAQHFYKSIEYSKKLLAQYPKDKWVDDAYLLWARALLGVDDPLQSVKLLEDFAAQFPKSDMKDEAKFYLGVAYRRARKNDDALRALDAFLAEAPRHKLAPYALLERSRTLITLERPGDAAEAASELLKRFPKSELVVQARLTRAEARFAQREYDLAREDFRELGSRSESDQERFQYLLREADVLEAARKYDPELQLLRGALAHERAPADSSRQRGTVAPTPGSENYGRLLTRIGTVHLLAGRQEEALASYRRVAADYPRTDLAAEAQYRIGYAYETVADDFERARAEYNRVKEHGGNATLAAQVTQRLSNLERLAQYRSAGGDSVAKKAEAGFLLAELYLFQLEKPERALEEYRKIAQEFTGTPIAAKAMNAEAWVLSRRLARGAEAESLFWAVVRQYPATEAQIAARDYLELEGKQVPSELIRLPERMLARADSVPAPPEPDELEPLPGGLAQIDTTSKLGPPRAPGLPHLPGLLATPGAPGGPPAPALRGDPSRFGPPRTSVRRDSVRVTRPALRDSAGGSVVPPGDAEPTPPSSGAPR